MPALVEVVIEERLQCHGIDIGTVVVSCKRPQVKDQEASCYVQRFGAQEGDERRAGRPLSRAEQIVGCRWYLRDPAQRPKPSLPDCRSTLCTCPVSSAILY